MTRKLRLTALVWLTFGLASIGWSQTADSSSTSPITIAIISDLNSAYGSTSYHESVHETLNYIINDVKPDLVLAGGDMIAGQKPELSDDQVRSMWQAFDSKIAKRLREANIPFAFTIGNHDGSGHPHHRRDRRLAKEYWQAHQPDLYWDDQAGFPFYYSFKLKDMQIAVWDASTAVIPDSNLSWLKKNFSQSSTDQQNFRLLIGHLPLYGVAPERDTKGNVLEHPQQMHALMQDLHIDLYISGHHHAFYPAQKNGLYFLHSGAIGSGPRKLLQNDKPAVKAFTILEIHPQTKRMQYTTFNADSWDRIPHSSLPDSIESRNGTIYLSGEHLQLQKH
ncbi:MAG: metallophosphoesterase [Fodinibius sp.]|nr:metallophosphoesterase [Fodinibius sp.]